MKPEGRGRLACPDRRSLFSTEARFRREGGSTHGDLRSEPTLPGAPGRAPARPHTTSQYMDPAALDEMTASVSQMRIIEPAVCRQDGATGLCYVVAGERRCATVRKDGLPIVPAVFIDGANCAEIAFPLSLLHRGGPCHADRIHERPEGHPGGGHHPGGEEQERTDTKMKAA